MSNNETVANIKDALFNPHVERVEARRSKDILREELTADIEAWLAQGNCINKAPPAYDCPGSRKVQVTDPSYFF